LITAIPIFVKVVWTLKDR